MRNLRFLVEYDGTGYAGWQRQAKDVTVQGAMEGALRNLLREEVSLIGAGRTDAGVHATGQVANCRTGTVMEAGQVLRGINALLPDDIVVLACADVPEAFHARFDAVARRYLYTLSTVPSALERHRIWHVRHRMDLTLMAEAAGMIGGTHDFSSFCKADSGVRHHMCSIRDAAWTEDGKGLIRFSVTADRFLRGMVRALVGTMIDVGRGYRTVGDFSEILLRKSRVEAGAAAPPHGLVLEEVYYGREQAGTGVRQ